MTRLTQQKYDLTCALMKAGFEIHSGNEHLLFAAVDAYADARESKEIAELKAEIEGLKTDMQHSRLIEAAQVKEANELNAEIKRLRDGIQKEVAILRMLPMQNRTECIADLLLSPAPVTHHPDILTKILALPDDTSAAYINALIHDHIKTV